MVDDIHPHKTSFYLDVTCIVSFQKEEGFLYKCSFEYRHVCGMTWFRKFLLKKMSFRKSLRLTQMLTPVHRIKITDIPLDIIDECMPQCIWHNVHIVPAMNILA